MMNKQDTLNPTNLNGDDMYLSGSWGRLWHVMMRNNQNTPQPSQSHSHKSYTHTGSLLLHLVMFLWVFRATVLAHWIARHNRPALLAWANPTRAAKPSFPLGRDCMLLQHGEVSILPWTSDTDEHWISTMSWLLKQKRDPTWNFMHPIVIQFPCIYILIRMVWIPKYMIMLCGSTL